MSITTIVIIVSVILVLSIIVSVIITKREQTAALRRQQVASYRLKADDAQDLYDGLLIAGLEKHAYKFLLERIVSNLQEAYNIAPKTPGIKTRLNSAKHTLENIDTMVINIQMPGNIMELHGLIGRLNKFIKYLMLLLQNKSISESIYHQLIPSLQRSSIKFDVEGHIKMGHQAANTGQAGTAKQSYLHAREKLVECDSEDAYAQRQLQKVNELLENLEMEPEQNDNGATNETDQSTQQETDETSEISQNNKEVLESQQAVSSQKEMNEKSDSDGDFVQKKKW